MADTEQTIQEQAQSEAEPPRGDSAAQRSPGAQAPGAQAQREQQGPAGGDPAQRDRQGPADGDPHDRQGAAGGDPGEHDRQGPVDGDAGERERERQGSYGGEGGEEAAPVAEQDDELAGVVTQRDEYLALAQRTQADFENYRKRATREGKMARERGVATLAKELLPALDNLDRALREAQGAVEGNGDGPLLAGLRLVRSELGDALGRVGIESFSPQGEPFDPELHEAMAQQAVEGAPSETVVEVYQPGYRLGSTILRAARVVVAA